ISIHFRIFDWINNQKSPIDNESRIKNHRATIDSLTGQTPPLYCSKVVSIDIDGDTQMLKATAGMLLPTTITGSLPRPSWYTENLGTRSFLDAMVTSRFREQYVDALSVYLREQEVAGLDIVTDGDCRFDQDIGGQSWTSYPPHHMAGFETTHPKLAK